MPWSIEAALRSGSQKKRYRNGRPTVSPSRGAQWVFTDTAIETCLQIKVVYGLTLRETEGFVESLVELMGLEDLPVPDYTTLSKRQGDRSGKATLTSIWRGLQRGSSRKLEEAPGSSGLDH